MSNKNYQLNLFGNHKATTKLPPTSKHKSVRKYGYNHWSFEQRTRHLISSSHSVSWKDVYFMVKERIIHDRTALDGRKLASVRLHSAVKMLRLQKTKRPQFKSINKLAQYYRITKPTLYKYYYRKYGK